MFHLLFALVILAILLGILSLTVLAGRRYGLKHMESGDKHSLHIVTVAEGAVFALLGLLVAFTFSDAYQRFEERKLHIIKEANAYDSAYMRLDLLAPSTQPTLRKLFYDYVDVRLEIYHKIPDFKEVNRLFLQATHLQKDIWKELMLATKITHDEAATELLVPAVNEMFDEANSGYLLSYIHSPFIIFVLLIGLAALGAYLAGYSTAVDKEHNRLYTFSYIGITAFTIFLIINLELPRIGIVRLSLFDHVIEDMRAGWSTPENLTLNKVKS